MADRLFLIDGHGYIYRAFFALPHLSTSKGLPTNAVYGFTTMLLKVVREHQPDYLAVVFDSAGPTQRHSDFEAYKAHRPAMPDPMAVQLPYIERMVDAFAIPSVVLSGMEADDLIGTLARQAEAQGLEVTIVTADKDMLQLVTPRVRVYNTLKEKVYGEAEVRERFGVGPELVADVLGLMGDTTDNIPGVPGIGEKTAVKLVTQFGGVEAILAKIDDVAQPKLRAALQQHAEQARLSRRLATIAVDCPVTLDRDRFRRRDPDLVKLTALCRELEFSTLLNSLSPAPAARTAVHLVNDPAAFADALRRARANRTITLMPAWTGGRPVEADLAALAYVASDEHGVAARGGDEPWGNDPLPAEFAEPLAALLADPSVTIRGHDLKPLIGWAGRRDLPVRASLWDTMLAAYLLNPNRPDQGLASVSLEYLSRSLATPCDLPSGLSDWAAAADALGDDFRARIAAEGHSEVLERIELPLIPVLAQMECHGIRVDADLLRALGKELDVQLGGMMQRLYSLAGGEFNLNSPKQLADILFNRLGLPAIKKTKTGFSTDEGVLTQLAAHHELPAEILAYRQIAKLKSTYVDALPLLVSPRTGRIHTTYHQAVAATGRLSSVDPNLQNIPIKGPMGPRIRAAFIADPGYVLVSADYSQIELRILAHLSGDARLIHAFTTDGDIHTDTARTIFGLPTGDITPAMRRAAKTVNFGIIYGISAFGLADQLGVAQGEAKRYIEEYFAHYHGVKRFVDETIATAKKTGTVTTLLGRTRPIPELQGATPALRGFGERSAVNSPIQGSAADIIKLAMVNIHHRLGREGLHARMLLQVHDELVFEVTPDDLDALKAVVKAEMEGAYPLSVPTRVEIGVGPTWADAH